MFEHVSYHVESAKIIESEILADSASSWYDPGDKNHIYFSDSRIRFVNRNLNYFYFDNMLLHAIKDSYQYNKNYIGTLNFCNSIRDQLNEHGPFGKMAIWEVKPFGKIHPHIDSWIYHRNITRYIISASNHSSHEASAIIGGNPIDINQGLLFNFSPSTDAHEFTNNTDRPWHFIAFDYWKVDKLAATKEVFGYTADTDIEYIDGFGNKKNKYLSKE